MAGDDDRVALTRHPILYVFVVSLVIFIAYWCYSNRPDQKRAHAESWHHVAQGEISLEIARAIAIRSGFHTGMSSTQLSEYAHARHLMHPAFRRVRRANQMVEIPAHMRYGVPIPYSEYVTVEHCTPSDTSTECT